jgi:hypothetical protein
MKRRLNKYIELIENKKEKQKWPGYIMGTGTIILFFEKNKIGSC